MKKQIPFMLLLLALLAGPQVANAQNRSSLEEMQQRLLEMQRQMMQGFQDLRAAMPDMSSDSSGIYFHFDTTFTGDGAHFFRFAPPGELLDGNSGIEDFFRGFSTSLLPLATTHRMRGLFQRMTASTRTRTMNCCPKSACVRKRQGKASTRTNLRRRQRPSRRRKNHPCPLFVFDP